MAMIISQIGAQGGGLYADEKLIINTNEFLVDGQGCFSKTQFI